MSDLANFFADNTQLLLEKTLAHLGIEPLSRALQCGTQVGGCVASELRNREAQFVLGQPNPFVGPDESRAGIALQCRQHCLRQSIKSLRSV